MIVIKRYKTKFIYYTSFDIYYKNFYMESRHGGV